MIRKSGLGYIKIAILIVLINLPSIAFTAGCCITMEPEYYLVSTDLIFKGTVLAVEPLIPPNILNSSMAQQKKASGTRVKFKVSVSYKGFVHNEVYVDHLDSIWRLAVGDEITVFADSNLKAGYYTNSCLMLPAYAISHGDMRFQSAIEAYRDKQNVLEK